MKRIARWLRRAADWLDPPAPSEPIAPAPAATPQGAGPGPQLLLVHQALAAEYLRRALRRYSPSGCEYRA